MTVAEQISKAIDSQRWYFFSNNDKILFDRNTALIWANLEHFPYTKENGQSYSFITLYSEVKDLLKQKNSERWGGFGDWKIPTPYELWNMIEDKTFPFQTGTDWRIKDFFNWCVDNGDLAGKDLYYAGATKSINAYRIVCVLPCSHALVPKNFSETSQEILEPIRSRAIADNRRLSAIRS